MGGDHSAPAAPWERVEHLAVHGCIPVLHPVLGTGPLLNGAGLLQEVERKCAKELSSCSLPFMKKDLETLF